MAIDPVSGTQASSATAASSRPAGGGADFAAVLVRHLERPRAEIASVRAEIASLRNGGMFAPPDSAIPYIEEPGSASPNVAELAARYATGDAADPYGWRQLARETAEAVIGPGYGWLFERQIDQESGFAPDVVFGSRTSTAGAEGIAQLMPQYYAGVDRSDPEAGLLAGAQTMRHYLTAWDGDVRKALASYNAGLGRVRSAVASHGEAWEDALPAETRQYLHAILGSNAPRYDPPAASEAAVFGGRGPGGVLSVPVDGATGTRGGADWLEYLAAAGSAVRAPSDGVVLSIDEVSGYSAIRLDHGNGWQSTLFGLGGVTAGVGDVVSRGQQLGALVGGGAEPARLRLGISYEGRALDPSRYLLPI
jgi:soluble lytic murein transglycosylase-like protein